MKKILILAMTTIPSLSFSQNEGTVIYEESMQMEFNMMNSEKEEIKSMMPKSSTSFKQLLFTSSQSIYTNYENLEKEDNNQMNFTTSEGNLVKIQMKQPDNIVYRDLENGILIDKRDFMGKNFIITEPLHNFEWKLSGETKTILDYTVQKATMEDSAGIVEAWFTAQIPVSIGPLDFGNLPGLILQLSLNDGKRLITASKIDLTSVDTDKLIAPKKGKDVSREEFDKIVKEKMKEMEEMYGGKGGNKVMIIEH